MANQIIHSDSDLSTIIASGLNEGDRIEIKSGSTLTITTSPPILLGQIRIEDGELILDGANAINPIIYVGAEGNDISSKSVSVFRSTLGWWEFPTIGDGTANQTFDCSTYFSNSIITADVLSGVWVETGRRLNYTGGSGIAPSVGDWLYAINDQSIHGRIDEVSGDGITGYVVVRFLTGSLANNDTIELHTLQDNKGPDYQKSWNAIMNGVDVLEPGIYQEFGNATQNSTAGLGIIGAGMAGFGYDQTYQSNTLLFGDGINGFIVPNGAKIRIPMVHFATGTIASVSISESVWSTEHSKYELETGGGGACYLNGVSMGSAYFEDSLGGDFIANYCAGNINFGVYACLKKAYYSHCIFVSDIVTLIRSASRSSPPVVDLVLGALLSDCLGLCTVNSTETTQFGGQTSIGVRIERCIQISYDIVVEVELLRITDAEVYDLVVIGTQFTINSSKNVDVKLLKTQQMVDGSISGGDGINITAVSDNITITGWEALNNSVPNDSKIVISDSSNIKIRGYHFINDKLDNDALGLIQGEEFASIFGFCNNIIFARCWTNYGNPKEFALITSGTVQNLSIMNCSQAYNGEIESDGINTSFMGVHGGSGRLGASDGIETDLKGTTGSNFGDIFRSDTTGGIFYTNCPDNLDRPFTEIIGNPKFTKDGDVDVVLGDSWIAEMPYTAMGHTSFTGLITTTRNGTEQVDGLDTWNGVDIDFQYDNGGGYNGVWLNLRISSNLTSITNTVDGIRLKLRFIGNKTQSNGQALAIHTTTTLADQQANLHPIDQNEATLTLTGLKPLSDVVILQGGTSTVLASVDQGGTSFNYTYNSLGTIDIGIINPGYVTQYIYGYELGTTDSILPIIQVTDRNYD